jgi:hypothetical protein
VSGTSVMSTLNPSSAGTAHPAIVASPIHAVGSSSGGSTDGLCSASRGSRFRSASLRESGIEPNVTCSPILGLSAIDAR